MSVTKLSRRGFLKLAGATTGGLLIPPDFSAAAAERRVFPLHKPIGESHTICPYCSVGCGLVIATDETGHISNVEGDPDHITNRGALDPKSISVRQLSTSPNRLSKVLYRAPYSTQWEEKDWDWAIAQIADRVKATRDATFTVKDENGVTVNRTEAIAYLGGAANNNEDCYIAGKLMRALGLVRIDHQARLCHSSTVPGLANTYGRGAMTNHWIDLKNSDCIFVIGANPAENHPASMNWVTRAQEERGAKLVVVDPRFTRTAARADVYAPLRPGTDIAFLGGMINYVLENKLYHEEYVKHYTDASFIVSKDFKGADELDGLFSGYNPDKRAYDKTSWAFEKDAEGNPLRDMTLQDPRCVFQLLKKHYARYTVEMVEKVTGCPKDQFLRVAETFAATGQPGKSGTILYAMGQTQHTVGSQNVRAMAMLQLLLGNIGLPGGGVNAMRGESNVQGSTDMALLFHIIPAYMNTPDAAKHPTLADYLEKETPKSGYWKNKPKFLVSLLKAWWGDAATPENDFAFDYLPKIRKNYSWISIFEDMYKGEIKGLWIMGQNPAVSGPNGRLERKALENLEWMVIQEIIDTETVSFWKAPGVDPKTIKTEVFALPAADAMEKEGSIVTSGRCIQWRPRVAKAPGEAKPDIWIFDKIYKAIKKAYEGSTDPKDRPILDLNWNYGDEPDINLIAKEINGYWTRDVLDQEGKVVGTAGKLISSFANLADDGSTACGCWIYTGYFVEMDDGEGHTLPASKRRGTKDPGGLGIYPYWGYTWPLNRHIIYNRCSADPAGKPWSPDKALIWWDAEKGVWTGYDVPDFGKTVAPDGPGGDDAFIMTVIGKASFFGSLNEGPFPEHYEPAESPVQNLLSSVQLNPVVKVWDTDKDKSIGDALGTPDKFPIVATTYRLVEHWQAGGMSRWLGWLAEMQPNMFVEISQELAEEKGIKNGEMVEIESARGKIKAVALVTGRFKPLTIDGKQIHHVGMPWHYGWAGLATGDCANDLTPHIGDGNTMIPEYKAFLVNLRKAV